MIDHAKTICRHTEPPPMTEEELAQRKNELQQRHKCLECGRLIYSQFWMEWTMKHQARELEEKISTGWAIVDRNGRIRRQKDIDVYLPAVYKTASGAKDDMFTDDQKVIKVEVLVRWTEMPNGS